jgi:cytochrome c556
MRRTSLAILGVVSVFAVSIAVRAQQGPPAGAGAKPLVPMTASSLLRNPKAHIGDNVSLMATVDRVLSKTAFTLDQDPTKSGGPAVLVFAPTLNAQPGANEYVTVQGEVFAFDPAEVMKRAKGYTIDVAADVLSKFQGQPAIVATAVVTPKLVDLAKKVLPPMTPAELSFQKAMLAIQPASGELRNLVAAPDAGKIKEQTAILRKAFTEVEGLFKTRNMTEAAGWAGDVLKTLSAVDAAVAAGKGAEELKAAAGPLQAACAQCHGVYRERQDDGSFRIKG